MPNYELINKKANFSLRPLKTLKENLMGSIFGTKFLSNIPIP